MFQTKSWANASGLFGSFCWFFDTTKLSAVLVGACPPPPRPAQQHVTLLCNFTCRYLTPCLIRLSPMPSCTCPGRRAVTPSPLPAARGPWRSSTPCNQQRNVSPTAQGQQGAQEMSCATSHLLRVHTSGLSVCCCPVCPWGWCVAGPSLVSLLSKPGRTGSNVRKMKGQGHLLCRILFSRSPLGKQLSPVSPCDTVRAQLRHHCFGPSFVGSSHRTSFLFSVCH